MLHEPIAIAIDGQWLKMIIYHFTEFGWHKYTMQFDAFQCNVLFF